MGLGRFRNLSLGVRLAIACTLAEICLLVLLIVAATGVLETRLRQQALLRAEDIGELLSTTLGDALVRRDFGQLDEIAKAARAKEDIDYVLVADLGDRTLALAGLPSTVQPPKPHSDLYAIAVDRVPRLDIRRPVLVAGQTYGHLQFGFSTRAFVQARADLVHQLALLGGAMIVLSIALFAVIGRLLTSNLGRLTRSVERLAEGDLDIRLPIRAQDEVGRLGQAFNRMADALQARMGELEDNQHQLNALVDRLSRSNRDLERFAYIASHDLQEPLRTVVNYSQLLQRNLGEKLDPKQRDNLGFVISGATRMHELVRDLLAFSRATGSPEAVQTVDMAEIMTAVREAMASSLEDSRAQLVVGDMPVIRGHKMQMYEVMQNLVGNAIKFRRPGVPPLVTVSAEMVSEGWRFAVSDNGIGIEAEYFDKIFEIFRRLHGPADYSGTGIGLAVCKRIIEGHGGRIWAESRPGAGATFYFTLPREGG